MFLKFPTLSGSFGFRCKSKTGHTDIGVHFEQSLLVIFITSVGILRSNLQNQKASRTAVDLEVTKSSASSTRYIRL